MKREYEGWRRSRQIEREGTRSQKIACHNYMFSVVLFNADIDPALNARTLESLLVQQYRNIEVVVVGKSIDAVEWVDRFQILRGLFHEPDLSPSDFLNEIASNSVWRGNYLLFAEAGTEFDSDCFCLFNATIANADEGPIDLAVIDHDRRSREGVFQGPVLMPGWDPDLALELDYVGTAFLLSRNLAEARRTAGPVGNIYDGLKSIARMHPQPGAVHISEPVIHLLGDMPMPGARAAFAESPGTLARQDRRLLTIVIPNRNRPDLLARSLGFLKFDNQFDVDLVIVDNKSDDPRTWAIYADIERRHAARILRADHDFNFARMVNLGVWTAHGEIVMLMNNDVEFSKPDQIEQLVRHALRPEVGVVGSHLFYPDGRIQHAGMSFSTDSRGRGFHPHHLLRGAPEDGRDYLFIKSTIRNYDAVTGAVHVMRRELFISIGGYDEVHLPVEYNDVDFCLRVRKRGLRVICLPLEGVFHAESESRRHLERSSTDKMRDDAIQIMNARWSEAALKHCFVNPWVELGDCAEPRFRWKTGSSSRETT